YAPPAELSRPGKLEGRLVCLGLTRLLSTASRRAPWSAGLCLRLGNTPFSGDVRLRAAGATRTGDGHPAWRRALMSSASCAKRKRRRVSAAPFACFDACRRFTGRRLRL